MTTHTAARRQKGLDPLIALGLAAVLVFFLVSGGLAYFNIITLQDDSRKIIRSDHVIIALDDLLSAVKDAETGQRGFLLTDNENYLAPYRDAKASIATKIDGVATLVQDDPTQSARLGPLAAHINAKMSELALTIEVRRTKGPEAALAEVLTDRGKSEMDAIRNGIAGMDAQEDDLRDKRVVEMSAAFTSAVMGSVFSAVLGIVLACMVAYLVRRTAVARQREEWFQVGRAGLGMAMLGDLSAEQLGEGLLSYLARYLGAHAGAVYIGGGNAYGLVSTYGVPAGVAIPQNFGRGDGLLGQAAAEGRPVLIGEAPEGYLAFGSALGRDKPRHLVISPAGADGVVNAVVELGFIRAVDEDMLALLAQTSEPVAIAVRSASYRSELQKLLEETQRQSEALQVQGEELRVSNEELEEQSRALKESQARLEQQQIELEQTNSQLEEQALQLEAQRDDLERVNTAIQAKASEVEQASRYKSDFLANMSHELRTPLNSSLILAKLLADNPNGNLNEEQVKYATTIQASGADLLNLINDILDLSKIEAGHVEIKPDTVSLAGVAKGQQRLFQPVAEEKGLAFSIEIASECPKTIVTDAQRIEQVLKNLLSNAIKFTERGGVKLSIKAAGDNQIAFAVVDSGIGIPEQHQQSVFEAFRQADGTISRRYGGTGLGLSISRQLARLLGGSIWLASREGEGSTFTVVLPTTYDSATAPPVETAAPAAAAPEVFRPAPRANRPATVTPLRSVEDDRESLSGARRVLLVIEDDENFARILRDLAREMGLHSLVAGTGEEALVLAKRYKPSAVVLDVGLPDQSGLSVLDRLKRDVETRHIPIHVISGNDHAETALALGAVGHMLKPVKREELADVLTKLEAKFSQAMHRVLIVEDDAVQRDAVARLLSSGDVETVGAGTAAECLELLKSQTFDCMVLDLSLPDASGYSLLETLSREEAHSFPPVIVYTGRDLSADDEQRLRRYSKSIIIKGAKSPERLLDEVTLFLHQVVSKLPDEQQRMIRKARNRDDILENRRILVVEDDVRNVYALTNILEPRGAVIEIARNGKEAVDKLDRLATEPGHAIDLVLMDVMMPIMDGLTATREIRGRANFKKLPIIALTAKAMPDDQQRCIDAGANDYMAKPLDVEKLLSLVRVWMPR